MKVVYHIPSLDTIYANRTIYFGYKNALEDMGHEFYTYTAGVDLDKFLTEIKPDIFITSSHFFWRKQLDYQVLKKHRHAGMSLVCKIDFWNSPIDSKRINEAKSMSHDESVKSLIKRGLLADFYFHVVEQGDIRMDGFEGFAKAPYTTIPLAVDKTLIPAAIKKSEFTADISFIGTNLPQKRKYFKEWLIPLKEDYDLKLYGQDWTSLDRAMGNMQRVGQYLNIPILRSLVKPKLKTEDEYAIYASSKLCVNLHEDYQRRYGGDCNERTFKIPASGCLEISDDVSCVSKYFKDGEHIILAHDKDDWFTKIKFYMENPVKAQKIARAGKRHVLAHHTYHNRSEQILALSK